MKKKICDLYDHQWIVKADSADIKFYECEWCEAEMRQPKRGIEDNEEPPMRWRIEGFISHDPNNPFPLKK